MGWLLSLVLTTSLALSYGLTHAQGTHYGKPQSTTARLSPLPGGERELPPPIIVYPGEILFLRTDVPHDPGYRGWMPTDPPDTGDPEFEWLEFGRWEEGYWSAFGGTVLSTDERTVVWQAPQEPGLAFLEWNDGVREPIWLAFVVPGGEVEWDYQTELALEQLDGLDGSYLPAKGGKSFRLFAVHPCGLRLGGGQRPCGQGFEYAGDLRLVPSKRPKDPCQNGDFTRVHNYKVFYCPEDWRIVGRFRLFGNEVVVYLVTQKVRHMWLWDCYECRDGNWIRCGNVARTKLVESFRYVPPVWFGRSTVREETYNNSGCCK